MMAISFSFVPKLFEAQAGSDGHLHLSLWRDNDNLIPSGQGELSAIAQSFAAGRLHTCSR